MKNKVLIIYLQKEIAIYGLHNIMKLELYKESNSLI